MLNPSLRILVSSGGVEEVEVFYKPSQRTQAWRLCQRYLPLLLDDAAEHVPPGDAQD